MATTSILNINDLVERGNASLLSNNYQFAIEYYNKILQHDNENVVALINTILTLLLMQNQNIMSVEHNLQDYIQMLDELSIIKKEQAKKYIFNELYDDDIFDKIVPCFSCVDFICRYCQYSDEIMALFFSYYKSVKLDNIPLKNIVLFERDMVNFANYVKQYSKINLKVYSTDLHNYAKELLLRGNNYVFPFFKVALTLYDNNETQFYYYLSILIVCLNNNNDSYFDNLLVFEQKNVCSIRNNLLEYRTVLVNYVLNHILDESYKEKIHNSLEFEDSLNSRINVIFCVLQFIDGFYYGMEEDCYKLIVLLKYFIRCKLYGFGEENGKIKTFCNDAREFDYLKKIYNETLEKFGEQHKIHKRDKIQYMNNFERNRLLIPCFEKDVDNMFSYANLALANKFSNFTY